MSGKEMFKTRFNDMLIEINGLNESGFSKWLFHPGMLFGNKRKWWDDPPPNRPGPHEGLDLFCFQCTDGRIRQVPEQMKAPVMHDGIVKKISDDDFLGKSIYVVHPHLTDDSGQLFYSIYAHSSPYENIREGVHLKAGDIVSQVVDFETTRAKMTHHLHISTAFLPEGFKTEDMVWKIMANPEKVTLTDPLTAIGIAYSLSEEIPGIEVNRRLI